jgi:uncharacterized protein (TIGR03437 family)
VNAASLASGEAPAGGLAQGSLFSIYGSDLGPDPYVKAAVAPFPKTLGGVSIEILSGSETYQATLLLASRNQINAALPADVPLGAAQLVVRFNGNASAPLAIQVSPVSIGIFEQELNGRNVALAQILRPTGETAMNLPASPAAPGDLIDLWVTGLGSADSDTPVSITIGGTPAQREYPDRPADENATQHIFFRVPSGIAFGCHVPLSIMAGGVAANQAAIPVTADGSPCE